MKVGIVGASEKKWPKENIEKVKERIESIFMIEAANTFGLLEDQVPKLILVSGHSPKGGVDIWAEEIADKMLIEKKIYPPVCTDPTVAEAFRHETYPHTGRVHPRHYWDWHYRLRNILIAEAIDILYVISPKCGSCDGKGYIEYPEQNTVNPLNGMTNWQSPCKACVGHHQTMGSGRIWNGGIWTGRYAENLGKRVIYIDIY